MWADNKLATTLLSGRVLNRNAKGGTPGTRFVNRNELAKLAKREARARILSYFFNNNFRRRVDILTFPSMSWIFEGMLLNSRAGCSWKNERYGRLKKVGGHTYIVGIEREEPIYRAALNLIPGVKMGYRSKDCPRYATASVRTFAIKRYLRCSFEDLAFSREAIDCKKFKFNAAWLDFNGFLSLRRKSAIESFLDYHTNGCRLIITAANCRYDKASSEVWGEDKLQGVKNWLLALGGDILYSFYYPSSIPMLEIAVDFPMQWMAC